jgi:MoaA/NifB/PqqE/SkfB family radical SAM enzyme
VNPWLYGTNYVGDINAFRQSIRLRSFIPHQVELQPGPLTDHLCWLECPYCYGKSSQFSQQRLSLERYLEVIDQIISGGVKKITFAGWTTDPLFYQHIDDLVARVADHDVTMGMNSRCLKISDALIHTLLGARGKDNYLNISVNAATNQRFNQVNAVGNSQARLYDRILHNVQRINRARGVDRGRLKIMVSYLVNQFTSDIGEVMKFIQDFRAAGADVIRFSCPQIPRGDLTNDFVPDPYQYAKALEGITPLAHEHSDPHCEILIVDEQNCFRSARTLPCFARFIFPTVGYDGWLYHCSQSSGPDFHSQALGDLATRDFWDLLYDYDANDLDQYFAQTGDKMVHNNCRCDRKQHLTNQTVTAMGFFR